MISPKRNCIYCWSLLLLLEYTLIEASSDSIGRRIGSSRNDENYRKLRSHQTRKTEEADGTIVENCWMQIGSDIDGPQKNAAFGLAVDLSSIQPTTTTTTATSKSSTTSQHITMAVGAYGNLQMFSYTFGTNNNIFNDGEWTTLGDKIETVEQPFDGFGHSTSLSANGRIVAVGAPSHNLMNEDGTETNGLVQVYAFTEANSSDETSVPSWSQLGQDIGGFNTLGQKDFGNSVALSDDGYTLICGIKDSGIHVASTRIFRYDDKNNVWNLLGNEIEGFGPADESGESTSMSSDGNIVAIGSNHQNAVRVFQFKPEDMEEGTVSGTWELIGEPIMREDANDRSGASVSLSANGQSVAVGADGNDGTDGTEFRNSGHVRIYRFNSSTPSTFGGVWEQVGKDIDGEAHSDYSGSIVSLSDDAGTVAIGAWANDGNGPVAGHARVYRYDTTNNDWMQYGPDIDGQNSNDAAGAALSLSPDGRIVAVGSRAHDGKRGHIRVFANTNENCTITAAPSPVPSSSPNASPSALPSHDPSGVPSFQPSASPSRLSSQLPTSAPESKPSSPLPSVPTPPTDIPRGARDIVTPSGASSTRDVFALAISFMVFGITMIVN